jgi:hypothetical protein
MQKSAFTTVFLIAILLTGAISTALPSLVDTEASSDKKDKKKDKDKANERDYDKKDKRDYDKKDKRDYDKKDKRDYDKKDKRDYDKKDKRDYDNYNKYPNKELNKPYPKPYPEPDTQPYPKPYPEPDTQPYPKPYPKPDTQPYPEPYPEQDTQPYPETAKDTNSYSKSYNYDKQPIYENGYDKSYYLMDSIGVRYNDYKDENNKYECRTGPLEGFFVSSVEFCKHDKFDKDDRKDPNQDLNQPNTTSSAEPTTISSAQTNITAFSESYDENHNRQPVGNASDDIILETATANNNNNTGVHSPTASIGTGASSALLPSIQQMNPTIQQNNLPTGDPMLQLNLGLSPIS